MEQWFPEHETRLRASFNFSNLSLSPSYTIAVLSKAFWSKYCCPLKIVESMCSIQESSSVANGSGDLAFCFPPIKPAFSTKFNPKPFPIALAFKKEAAMLDNKLSLVTVFDGLVSEEIF